MSTPLNTEELAKLAAATIPNKLPELGVPSITLPGTAMSNLTNPALALPNINLPKFEVPSAPSLTLGVPNSVIPNIGITNATAMAGTLMSKQTGADEAKYSGDSTTATTSSDGVEQSSNINVLHNFSNFTYLLTLHMMSMTDLTALLTKAKIPARPTVIISSGGRATAGIDKHEGWGENFYIEDLSMDSVIGLNALARGSNAVRVAFKIIEPNGVSLIERLIQTTTKLNCVNFKDVIYVMQVDFTGYDNNGTPVAVKGHTKYIPITITGVGFKVTERGAEYAVSAVPFNHQALTQLRLTAPMNISITASTVSEYFTDGSILPSNANSTSEGRETSTPSSTKTENAASFMSAINKFERMKVTQKHQEVADIYNVVFDDDIRDSLLVSDASQEAITTTPLYTNDGAEPHSDNRAEKKKTLSAKSDNLDLFFSFGEASGSKEAFLKLNAELQQRMLQFAKQWFATKNTRIKITSAFRTAADQERIYKASLQPGAKYPANQPGKSLHERGLAVDIDSQQANAADKLGYLAANGLYRPVPKDDPVHIIMTKTAPSTSVPLSSNSNVSNEPINVQPSEKGQIKYGTQTTEINSGTVLIDEINKVIKNSSFCHNQLSLGDEANTKTEPRPLKWWKIVPEVELLAYDHIRQTFGKKITYHVKTYNVYSSVMPGTPHADPPISRTYNYLFTGKNQDIKDFNLEFNTQFYIAMSVNVNNWKATSMSADSSTPATANTVPNQTVSDEDKKSKAFGSVPLNPVPNNAAATAGAENKRDAKSRLAGDVQEMLLNQRGGDMVSLNMTILGDPAFIKQDDIFTGADTTGSKLNGSLTTDEAEVYIQVEFKTPIDVDSETGLMTSTDGGNTRSSKFSGLYRVLKVESTFARGEFHQKIEGVRIFTDTLWNPPSNQEAAAAR